MVMKKYADELSGKLLDFGCGAKPYKSLFSHVFEYIGVDVENEGHSHENENIDIYYDGHTLPFKNETFDCILSNEVLEHVPNLRESLTELNRVLKPGGKIMVTVPFVCFEHELPYDFRRFTVNGLIKF
jgi:ubiquinone/menaquinone biosynthesis C-methylase UbiE